MIEKNITIMKYRIKDEYFFKVLDKYDEADPLKRFDMMRILDIELDNTFEKDYQMLWIKETVIV